MERRRLNEMQQDWEQLGREKDTLEKRVREGLGRAEWELAIIERRRRELAGTDEKPVDAGEEVDVDDVMVGVGLRVAETTAIQDLEDVGLLEGVPRRYAAVQQRRRVLDERSTNQAAIGASQKMAMTENLLCDRQKRKRKRRDADSCGE